MLNDRQALYILAEVLDWEELHHQVSGYFAMVGAFSLFSLAFAPFFASMALRIGVHQ